jgi:hypothetical protein
MAGDLQYQSRLDIPGTHDVSLWLALRDTRALSPLFALSPEKPFFL